MKRATTRLMFACVLAVVPARAAVATAIAHERGDAGDAAYATLTLAAGRVLAVSACLLLLGASRQRPQEKFIA